MHSTELAFVPKYSIRYVDIYNFLSKQVQNDNFMSKNGIFPLLSWNDGSFKSC